MPKTAVDAEINNQIFRKDWSAVIAVRRDLAQLGPVRLAYNANGYSAGQCLARVVSTGVFGAYSAVSGLTIDSKCVLFENINGSDMVSTLSGGSLARAIFSGYVYQAALIDYVAGSSLNNANPYTDATGISIVKF